MLPRPSPGRFAAVVAVVLAATAGPARADTINLLTYNTSGAIQGTSTSGPALFYQANPQPTGTGYIDPFVRIQQTGTEAGYNTDARPVEFQTKDENQWTHSLLLSSLTPVTLNGTQYYQFALDINESNNATNALLSMDAFQVYLGTSGSLTGFTPGSGFSPSTSRLVYNMDTTSNNSTVNLNYSLNSGSGSGDLYVYVPVSLFQGAPSKFQYVYLYSAFGDPYASNAGFEEWSALTGTPLAPPPPPPPGVPAPPGLVLAGMGIACCLVGRLRRRTAATA